MSVGVAVGFIIDCQPHARRTVCKSMYTAIVQLSVYKLIFGLFWNDKSAALLGGMEVFINCIIFITLTLLDAVCAHSSTTPENKLTVSTTWHRLCGMHRTGSNRVPHVGVGVTVTMAHGRLIFDAHDGINQ